MSDFNVKNLLNSAGKGAAASSSSNLGQRNVYPAVVVSIIDPTDQNRIKARIVVMENGKIKGAEDGDDYVNAAGKDAFNRSNEKLQWCMPLIPEFLHVRPQIGEMVWVILENPKLTNAVRYWTGPIITSKYRLSYQKYQDAHAILSDSDILPNKISNKPGTDAFDGFPKDQEVALQGRGDADLILKNREALLIAGKFDEKTTSTDDFKLNTETPCFLQLTQTSTKEEDIAKKSTILGATLPQLITDYSQGNLQSTNINLYSPIGSNRDAATAGKYEINEYLKFFDNPLNKDGTITANSLHPIVFGDELVKLLDIMIKVILNHIHTPQKKLASNQLSSKLDNEYNSIANLQKLLSKFIRAN